MFTLNQGGSGPAVIQNYVSPVSLAVNTLIQPAIAGQTAILYGTGLGPVTFDESGPAQSQDLTANLKLFVGGKPAQIAFAGRSSCCAGLDQINFLVPFGVESCFAPVFVSSNGVTSNFGSMSIALPGAKTCSDPYGLTATDFAKIQAGNPVKLGALFLNRTFVNGSYAEVATAGFYAATAAQFLGLPNVYQSMPARSCTVYIGYDGGTDGLAVQDAGPSMTVVGPQLGGKVPKLSDNTYSGLLSSGATPKVIIEGTVSLDNGLGGPDVAGFKQSAVVLAQVLWTNMDSISTVTRSKGLTVNWTGGDPKGFVLVFGSSGQSDSGDLPANFQTYRCHVPAGDGQFTVPPEVLSTFPAGSGSLYVAGENYSSRVTASNMDFGYIRTLLSSGKLVTYQ